MKQANSKNIPYILFCVISLGLILRVWGIHYGLPFFHYIDESHYLPIAMGMLKTRDFNPHYFMNPPLLTYLHAFLMACYFIIGKIVGFFSSPEAVGKLFHTNPTIFYLIARLLSALLGTATCLVIYKIGKRLFNKDVGLISCVLLSFCFLHLSNSRYAVNDVPGTFFMALSFLYIINAVSVGRLKFYILSGLFAGLAIATKYNMGIIIFALSISFVLYPHKDWSSGSKIFFLTLSSCIVGFFISCPWIFLDLKNFYRDFMCQAELNKQPWFGCSHESSYILFLTTIINGYGLIPSLFVLVGLVFLWRKKRQLILVSFFPLIYYLLLGMSKLFFSRFVIPMLPYLALISGYGIFYTANCFGKAKEKTIIIILVSLCVFQGIVSGVRENYLTSKMDTRIIARDWIKQHIPPHSKIITEGYGPNLQNFDSGGLINDYIIKDVWWDLPKKDLETYRQESYQYIITSDAMRNRYFKEPKKYAKEISFYLLLENRGEKLFQTSSVCKPIPQDYCGPFWNLFGNLFMGDCLGPEIKIYRIDRDLPIDHRR